MQFPPPGFVIKSVSVVTEVNEELYTKYTCTFTLEQDKADIKAEG